MATTPQPAATGAGGGCLGIIILSLLAGGIGAIVYECSGGTPKTPLEALGKEGYNFIYTDYYLARSRSCPYSEASIADIHPQYQLTEVYAGLKNGQWYSGIVCDASVFGEDSPQYRVYDDPWDTQQDGPEPKMPTPKAAKK